MLKAHRPKTDARTTKGSVHTQWEQVRGRFAAADKAVLRPSCSQPCAPGVPNLGSSGERRPHLCHLDHVGKLSEAGDRDDIMVCPRLGPGRRKPHGEGLSSGKGDGSSPQRPKGEHGARPGWDINLPHDIRQIPIPLWASMKRVGKMSLALELLPQPSPWTQGPPMPSPEQQAQVLLIPNDIILE